jgi:hypothetical protein
VRNIFKVLSVFSKVKHAWGLTETRFQLWVYTLRFYVHIKCSNLGLAVSGDTNLILRIKCKVYPRTGHEGPEGEKRYSSTLSLTSALGGGRWTTPRPGRFTPGKESVPIAQGAGRPSAPVWTGARNLAPTEIRCPDRPARSVSLYWLRYPGPQIYPYHPLKNINTKIQITNSKIGMNICRAQLYSGKRHIFTSYYS